MYPVNTDASCRRNALLKQLGLIILALLLAAGGAAYYLWSQLTQLPDWYSQPTSQLESATTSSSQNGTQVFEPSSPANLVAAEAAYEELQQRFDTQLAQPEINTTTGATPPQNPDIAPAISSPPLQNVELEVDAGDINSVVITTLAARPEGEQLLAASSGLNTVISPTAIETGIVLNTSNVDLQALSSRQRSVMQQALETFPALRNRDVYVAVEGKPFVQNGQLQFDASTRFKIGDLSLTIADVSERLGIAPTTVTDQLQLQLDAVDLETIQLEPGSVVITGSERLPQ
ncbi:MAG: hypothetical protein AAGF24_04495 [Cyanobacteria bacterium P01_H01_bin.121]